MSIPAILDLEAALEWTKSAMSRFLSWEGETLCDAVELLERERQIRQIALVLAGHVTAQLLSVQSALPLPLSPNEGAPVSGQGFGYVSQGKRPVQITTTGNVTVRLKLTYVLQRSPRQTLMSQSNCDHPKPKRIRGVSCGQGYYPVLRHLGCEQHLSPLVWSTVGEYGLLLNSFAVAKNYLNNWGIELSEQQVKRLSYELGQMGLALSDHWQDDLEAGTLPTGETLRGQRVVLHIDGGRTRLRRAKRGRRKANGRRGYHAHWREPKLFTLYAVDEAGNRMNTDALPITNDGTFGGVKAFMLLLERHLIQLGIVHAQRVLLVCDGAAWIWQRVPALLKRLGIPQERILELLDFYHAASHLQRFAEIALGKSHKARLWFESTRSTLRHRSLKAVLKRMKQLYQSVRGARKQKQLRAKLRYFEQQVGRFEYCAIHQQNLPIGSGPVESLIRQVVNLRLKGAGKFWLQENAEIVLHARCQWAAGEWTRFVYIILKAHLVLMPSQKSLIETLAA
jgi:hypothetical protein